MLMLWRVSKVGEVKSESRSLHKCAWNGVLFGIREPCFWVYLGSLPGGRQVSFGHVHLWLDGELFVVLFVYFSNIRCRYCGFFSSPPLRHSLLLVLSYLFWCVIPTPHCRACNVHVRL